MRINRTLTPELDVAIAEAAAKHRLNHEPHKNITDQEFLDLRIGEYLQTFIDRRRADAAEAVADRIRRGVLDPSTIPG